MTDQSLLDKERAKRLKKLVDTAKPVNLEKSNDRLFYNAIYDREEDYDAYKSKKYNYKIPPTNERLSDKEVLALKHSRYKSPEPRVQLDKQASYIVSSLFPDPKTLYRSSTDNLYSREKSYCVEKLLNTQLSNINFRDTAKKAIKLSLKQGLCYLQFGWLYEEKSGEDQAELAFLEDLAEKNKNRPKILEEIEEAKAAIQQEQQMSEMTGESKVIYDEPNVTILHANNVHVDPAVDSDTLEQAEYVIIEKYTTFFSLLKTPDRFKNLDLLYEKYKGQKGATQAASARNQAKDTADYLVAKGKANHSCIDFKIHYYEIWEKGKLSIMTVKDEIILDYKRRVYNDINYNIVPLEHNAEAGKLGGSSVYKTAEPLIEASDTMQDLMVAQWKKHIQGRTWLAGKNTNDEKLKVRLERGDPGLYEVKDINGIKEDRVPLPDGTVLAGKQDLEAQLRSNIGTDSMVGGQSAGSNIRTNGLMSAYNQTTQVQVNETALSYAAAFKKCAKLLLKINREFLTEPQIFAYTFGNMRFFNQQPKFYQMTGEDIPDDFDIDLNVKIISDPVEQAEKAEMKELFQMGSPFPWFNADRTFAEIASKVRGFMNPLDLVNPDFMHLKQVNEGQAKSVGNEPRPVYFGPISASKAAEQAPQRNSRQNNENRPGDQRSENTTPPQRNAQRNEMAGQPPGPGNPFNR